jgi:hypothetical protein
MILFWSLPAEAALTQSFGHTLHLSYVTVKSGGATCAEQAFILKLRIILISGQTVQKPCGLVLMQFRVQTLVCVAKPQPKG